MSSRRIGILGGTFDPIHIGHLIIASELNYRLNLDHLLFVPAGDPPHKPGMPLTPVSHRLEMLKLAIDGRPEFSIDRVDIDRTGPSYTNETLAILHDRQPDDDLVFLMGEDSLRDLPTWHQPEEIVRRAEIGVGARPGVKVDLDEIVRALPEAKSRITVVEVPLIGISSREIRQRVRTGMPISFQVPQAVERYIVDQRLYRP